MKEDDKAKVVGVVVVVGENQVIEGKKDKKIMMKMKEMLIAAKRQREGIPRMTVEMERGGWMKRKSGEEGYVLCPGHSFFCPLHARKEKRADRQVEQKTHQKSNEDLSNQMLKKQIQQSAI